MDTWQVLIALFREALSRWLLRDRGGPNEIRPTRRIGFRMDPPS